MAHSDTKLDEETKKAIESAAKGQADAIIQTLAPDHLLEFLFQRGPLATLAAAGAYALARGLFPSFSLQEAVFGASLLLVAAVAELLIWYTKRRSAERAVQRSYGQLEGAQAAYSLAEDRLRATDNDSPSVSAKRLLGRSADSK
jgi:hypothetical protein